MIRDDLTVISHSGTHRKSFREVMDIANTTAGIRQQRPLSPMAQQSRDGVLQISGLRGADPNLSSDV